MDSEESSFDAAISENLDAAATVLLNMILICVEAGQARDRLKDLILAVLTPNAAAAEEARSLLQRQSAEFEAHIIVSSRRIKNLQRKIRSNKGLWPQKGHDGTRFTF